MRPTTLFAAFSGVLILAACNLPGHETPPPPNTASALAGTWISTECRSEFNTQHILNLKVAAPDRLERTHQQVSYSNPDCTGTPTFTTFSAPDGFYTVNPPETSSGLTLNRTLWNNTSASSKQILQYEVSFVQVQPGVMCLAFPTDLQTTAEIVASLQNTALPDANCYQRE